MDFSQLIAVLLDVALGAWAYRLALQNRTEIRAVVVRLEVLEKKAGI